MKQILKSFAVLALVAVSASCAKERISAPSGEEAVVSFTVSAPVLQTRTIADGTTVDKVACCVYNSKGDLIEKGISQTVPMTGKSATFSTRLVTGQTYSFLFWAYKSNASGESDYYTLNKADKTVTVSYEGAKSNDESRDAFYRYIASKKITGAVNETVELFRPFAQLNFGVEKADIAAAKAADNITVSQSKVTVKGIGNVLNLTDGTVTGEVDATFDFAACPTVMTNPDALSGELLTVNDNTYGYVAMNYVLVDTKTLTNATLWIADANGNSIKEDGLEVNDVPLQGNYRTNVLGNLFTSAVVNKIIVNPAFETPDIVKVIEVEDIASANEVIEKYAAETKVLEVKFASSPNDAGVPSSEEKTNAIVTTPVQDGGTLNIEVSGKTETLYVGDYTSSTETSSTSDDAKEATVNITIPEDATIGTLVINAPSKTVYINGVKASEYQGTQIEKLEATTSMNTLVIEKGQVIETLIFHQGGLEIHGTVNAVEIKGTKENVFVRDCENLSDKVYEALKGYIATSEGYVGVQNEDKTWNIVQPVKMDGVGYATLQDAINAAGSEETTINTFVDIVTDKTITIPAGKKIVLNCNSHGIKYTGNDGEAIVVYGYLKAINWSSWNLGNGSLVTKEGGISDIYGWLWG